MRDSGFTCLLETGTTNLTGVNLVNPGVWLDIGYWLDIGLKLDIGYWVDIRFILG